MNIERIHYERKVSDNAYGNRSMSATAVVEQGEDVQRVMADLSRLLCDMLDQEIREEEAARNREWEEARLRDQAQREARLAARMQDEVIQGRRAPVMDVEYPDREDDEEDWDEEDDDD